MSMVLLSTATHKKLARIKRKLTISRPHLKNTNDTLIDEALDLLAAKEGVKLGRP